MSQSKTPLASLLREHLDGTDDDQVMAVVQGLRLELEHLVVEYSCAMDEVNTKISNLRREFDRTHPYTPIEHVKTRMKSLPSLIGKAQRLGCATDLAAIRQQIRDIAGIRVVCSFVEDAYAVADMLSHQPDLTVLTRKDYIANPKANGYQSLHLIVEVPVFLSNRVVRVPVEVQLRTIAMDFWASVEHQIHYKYDGLVPDHLQTELLEVAQAAATLDRQMGDLRDEIRSLATSD